MNLILTVLALQQETTYTRDVAPILHKHCVACHRPGGIGPFSLLTYKDAAKRAGRLGAFFGGSPAQLTIPPGGLPIPERLKPLAGRWDKDSDGKLSEDEIDALPERLRNLLRGEPPPR